MGQTFICIFLEYTTNDNNIFCVTSSQAVQQPSPGIEIRSTVINLQGAAVITAIAVSNSFIPGTGHAASGLLLLYYLNDDQNIVPTHVIFVITAFHNVFASHSNVDTLYRNIHQKPHTKFFVDSLHVFFRFDWNPTATIMATIFTPPKTVTTKRYYSI